MDDTKNDLSPEQLSEAYWESRLLGFEKARKPSQGGFEKYAVVIGVLMPILFYFLGWVTMACVAAIVFALITGGSLVSKRFKRGLQTAAQWLSAKVGVLMTWLFLAPIYLLGFTFVRFMQWIGGNDVMLLKRGQNLRSMWLEADSAERKNQCETNMFCAEKQYARGGSLKKWAFLTLSMLLLGECFLRVKGYHKPLLYMNDVYAGYKIQPNQHVRWEGGEVFINNQGMRNRYDVDFTKPKDTFRILLLGDSTLYGNDDLPQDVIYSERLEKLLSKVANGRRVEVLNFGVNGAGPHQNAGMMKRYPHAFESDIVLCCVPLMDVYRAKQDMSMSRWQMNRPHFAMETAIVYYLPKLRASFNNRNTFKTVGNSNYDQKELLEDGAATYVSMIKSAQESGAESWMEILPQIYSGIDADQGCITTDDFQHLWDYFQQVMKKNQQVAYLPLDVFKGKGKGTEVWHDPAHLGAKGHEYYAEYLFRQIEGKSHKWDQFKVNEVEVKP